MPEAKFTVDTHIFRELGELLVGRDSTALVELVKNAYDADATEVVVYGEGLSSSRVGRITVTDNGVGMSRDQFIRGFLRIASRFREQGERRSVLYQRRFTGAKGVGRLAAHKLARLMRIASFPKPEAHANAARPISAAIDWDSVESKETLDELSDTPAVQLQTIRKSDSDASGTAIELVHLRRNWTPSERARFFWEVETFRPPMVLIEVPKRTVTHSLLFRRPLIADTRRADPGFKIVLRGEFESGESYWLALAEATDWIIEIDASPGRRVRFAITPALSMKQRHPDAEQFRTAIEHPDPQNGPFFQARILAREGTGPFSTEQRSWVGKASGIRVYMEGFRVLPYGEPGDDWLEIDGDYARRQRSLRFLDGIEHQPDGTGETDVDAALTFRRKDAYFGAVFLTHENSPTLRVVVNREGFVPDAAFDNIKRLVRVGIDLSVRQGAAAKVQSRAEWRERRRRSSSPAIDSSDRQKLKLAAEESIQLATKLVGEAEKKATEGKFPEARKLFRTAAKRLSEGADANEQLLTERSRMQILAAVGLQMAAFVHEINGLLGTLSAIEDAVTSLRMRRDLSPEARREMAAVSSAIGDLRTIAERQASYLTDITSPDARRRRSPQKLAERFDAGAKIVEPAAARRSITIENQIPPDLKSPSMFPAEITLVFSNLLTNAIKAASKGGRVRCTARREQGRKIRIRIENTGRRVKLAGAERWFRPLESTTTELDPHLGQGMGMGLPITRYILEEYGAEIRFVEPERDFSTALEIIFP